ncbi:hypothetical protein CXB51_017031 [Gossypium anomalum]|uniref:DNA/RNA polymerases superfamily protein n=1 Tax=Gossypium anomalum TaxID=47600 RepID=A0A8J6CYC7_9ROSI|nr:hypothetical protein CXB51_017031 [Gossypium anomalum]
MDWLTLHDTVVNCKRKTIDLRCKNDEIVRIESSDLNGLPAVISSMKALSIVRKGGQAYFAYVIDSKVSEKKVESVPVVCEFPNVFPEELLDLPLVREVEFGIELVPGATPILIAPYRIAPTELKELKSQLLELTNRGFARSSFSPWGAPILFVKKKDIERSYCVFEGRFEIRLLSVARKRLRHFENYFPNEMIRKRLFYDCDFVDKAASEKCEKDLNLRQRRWLELLKDYELVIDYHSGKANVVDALKLKVRPLFLQQIIEAQKIDNEILAKRAQCDLESGLELELIKMIVSDSKIEFVFREIKS